MSRLPQNEVAPGYRRFQAKRLSPILLGIRGSGAGRRGHGLSSSFRLSPRIESTFVLSVIPARCRLSVRAFLVESVARLSTRANESWPLENERITAPDESSTSSVIGCPAVF